MMRRVVACGGSVVVNIVVLLNGIVRVGREQRKDVHITTANGAI
jgi:hypothetical protein